MEEEEGTEGDGSPMIVSRESNVSKKARGLQHRERKRVKEDLGENTLRESGDTNNF